MASTSNQRSHRKSEAKDGVKWAAFIPDDTVTPKHIRQSLQASITEIFGIGRTQSEIEFIKELNINGGFSFRLMMVFIFTLWYLSAVEVHYYIILHSEEYLIRCEIPSLEQCREFNSSTIIAISVRDRKPTYTDFVSVEYCTYIDHNYELSVVVYGCDYFRIKEAVQKEANQRPCHSIVKSIETNYYPKPLFHNKTKAKSLKDEFGLHCNGALTTLFWIAIRVGHIISLLFGGFSADIFGRKAAFVIFSLVHLVGFLLLFLPMQWGLVLGRFLVGAGRTSQFLLYLLFLELCSNITLLWMGHLATFVFPITNLTVFLLYHTIKHWKIMHLINTCMLLPLPFGFWYITESPRWLLFVGKKSKAWKALRDCGSTAEPNTSHLNAPEVERPSIREILRRLRQPIFGKRIILCGVIWFFSAITLFIHKGNARTHHMNFGIKHIVWIESSGELLVELIVTISAIRMGRKTTTFSLYCVLMVLDVFSFMEISTGTKVKQIMFCCHLIVSQAVYYLVVLYTAELFPTPYRATALCGCMIMYEFGAMFPEYLLKILFKTDWHVMETFPVFISTVACTLLICLLPGTGNRGLPDTDREALYMKNII